MSDLSTTRHKSGVFAGASNNPLNHYSTTYSSEHVFRDDPNARDLPLHLPDDRPSAFVHNNNETHVVSARKPTSSDVLAKQEYPYVFESEADTPEVKTNEDNPYLTSATLDFQHPKAVGSQDGQVGVPLKDSKVVPKKENGFGRNNRALPKPPFQVAVRSSYEYDFDDCAKKIHRENRGERPLRAAGRITTNQNGYLRNNNPANITTKGQPGEGTEHLPDFARTTYGREHGVTTAKIDAGYRTSFRGNAGIDPRTVSRAEHSAFTRSVLAPADGVGPDGEREQKELERERESLKAEGQEISELNHLKKTNPVGFRHKMTGENPYTSTYTLVHTRQAHLDNNTGVASGTAAGVRKAGTGAGFGGPTIVHGKDEGSGYTHNHEGFSGNHPGAQRATDDNGRVFDSTIERTPLKYVEPSQRLRGVRATDGQHRAADEHLETQEHEDRDWTTTNGTLFVDPATRRAPFSGKRTTKAPIKSSYTREHAAHPTNTAAVKHTSFTTQGFRRAEAGVPVQDLVPDALHPSVAKLTLTTEPATSKNYGAVQRPY